MFLIRKIKRSKWEDKDGIHASEISADAITADLKTQGKSLSFWRCEEIDDAILAVASARNDLDTIEVVWVADDELQDASGQRLRSTDGRTPISDLTDHHVDVYGLDYVRLGEVAKLIVAALERKQYKRSTRAGVRNLLVEAVANQRLNLEDLENKVKNEIEQALGQ